MLGCGFLDFSYDVDIKVITLKINSIDKRSYPVYSLNRGSGKYSSAANSCKMTLGGAYEVQIAITGIVYSFVLFDANSMWSKAY